MKEDHYQFTAVAALCIAALVCVVGMGVLVVLEHVTPGNSFGLEGIIETLKITAGILVGGLIAMTKSTTRPTQGEQK